MIEKRGERTPYEPDSTHLRFSCGIIIIRRFDGNLLKHLVKTHPRLGIGFDQSLKFLDDGGEGSARAVRMPDNCELPVEPGHKDFVVPRQPSAKPVSDENTIRHRLLFE